MHLKSATHYISHFAVRKPLVNVAAGRYFNNGKVFPA